MVKFWLRLRLSWVLVSLLPWVLAACSVLRTAANAPALEEISPDPDVSVLSNMSQATLQIAQKTSPDAILLQVDTNLVWSTFRFSNAANNLEIDVNTPTPDASPSAWTVQTSDLSPLLGQPHPRPLDLSALRAGPQRLTRGLSIQWPGCTVRALTLYREENQLVWVGFCDTPSGVVSAYMDAQTGYFHPAGGPPALLPPTATPAS